ncbi:MAG TPA: chorismate mutase [Longimicrobiales bacterium]|nr:chorismate mutase [Longimicrobiales bacterium]
MSAGDSVPSRLDALRVQIERVDAEIVAILARRLQLATEIGRVKNELNLPIMDPAREAEVVRRAASLAREHGIDPELARDVFWRIIAQARVVQHRPEIAGPRRTPQPASATSPTERS